MLRHLFLMSSHDKRMPRLVLRRGSNSHRSMLTPRQLRAARALLGWSRDKLSDASKVPAVTISEFETGKTDPRLTTVNKLRRALERAGVVFIDVGEISSESGEGVRMRDGPKA